MELFEASFAHESPVVCLHFLRLLPLRRKRSFDELWHQLCLLPEDGRQNLADLREEGLSVLQRQVLTVESDKEDLIHGRTLIDRPLVEEIAQSLNEVVLQERLLVGFDQIGVLAEGEFLNFEFVLVLGEEVLVDETIHER